MAVAVQRVEGLGQLRRSLRKLQGDAEDLREANARASSTVAAAAAARAPRRSGRLAATVRGSRAVGAASVRGGGAAVPYAGPIHWGWPNRGETNPYARGGPIAAQPFIVDAAQATEPVWLAAYERELRAAVDKVKGA